MIVCNRNDKRNKYYKKEIEIQKKVKEEHLFKGHTKNIDDGVRITELEF